MVPFTSCPAEYEMNGTGERDKGATAAPLSIPAAPRRNRCFALRSPPDLTPAVGSTRHPVSIRLWPPSLASSPCHPVSGSPISAGTQHPCHIQATEKPGGGCALPGLQTHNMHDL
jgi:hypothetical protein